MKNATDMLCLPACFMKNLIFKILNYTGLKMIDASYYALFKIGNKPQQHSLKYLRKKEEARAEEENTKIKDLLFWQLTCRLFRWHLRTLEAHAKEQRFKNTISPLESEEQKWILLFMEGYQRGLKLWRIYK